MSKRRSKNKNHAMHNGSLLFCSDSWMYKTLRLLPSDSPSVRQASPPRPISSPHGFTPNGHAPNFRPVYREILPRVPQNVASIPYQQPPTCPMHPMHPMKQQYMMLEDESQGITTSFIEPSSLYFTSPEPVPMALPASRQLHNLSFENDQQILETYGAAESNQRYEIGKSIKKERLTTDNQMLYDAIVAAFNETTVEKVAIKVKKLEEVAIKVEEVEGAQDSEVKVKVEEPERIKVRKIIIQNPEGIEIQLKSELEAEKERGTMKLENI